MIFADKVVEIYVKNTFLEARVLFQSKSCIMISFFRAKTWIVTFLSNFIGTWTIYHFMYTSNCMDKSFQAYSEVKILRLDLSQNLELLNRKSAYRKSALK